MTVPIRPPAAGSKITAAELGDLLGHWSAQDGPLYRLLADRIAGLADTGQLPSGLRLPPERELAAALSVSRNTSAAAYQLLRDEGLAWTRQGAGTLIAPHRTTPAAVHRASGFFAGLLGEAVVDVDLSLASAECAPPVAAALDDPASVLDRTARRAVTQSSGYHPLGWPPLRAAIAEQLSTTRQLPTQPEQVLVTTGAQQALDLLMRGQVLAGQAVAVEDPTFPGALDALHRAGGRPIGLPAHDGLDPGRLDQILRTHRPAVVYLIPIHHNPTGRVMPAEHRQHIAGLVAAHPDTVFVDDLVLADLTLDGDGPPVPALAAPCPRQPNVVTIGSVSKSYWGGLRIGWIRASTGLISKLGAAKAAADLGSTAYPQAIAAALLAGQHGSIIRWRARQLRDRRDTLEEALRTALPGWSWTTPPGGLSLWVRLPGQADAGAFAQAALRHGVAVVPGRLLSATNAGRDWLRLAYTLPPAQLRRAVPALAQAWQETGQARARQQAG